MRPLRVKKPSSRLKSSCVMSFKAVFFEVIDYVLSEMKHRFDENREVLIAVDAANGFLESDFEITALRPLATIQIPLPSTEEICVAKNFLLREEEKTKLGSKTLLQRLFPFKEAFSSTYRLFEAIETFSGSTAISESSFSALSRIDSIRRTTMSDQRLRELFFAFEKKRLDFVDVNYILREFGSKNRRIQLF